MAIDEIEGETRENTFRIPTITIDANGLDENEKSVQNSTAPEEVNNLNCTNDDDIILVESNVSTILIIDDEDEHRTTDLSKSQGKSLPNTSNGLESGELDLSQHEVIGGNLAQQNSNGLKSLSELPDFLFTRTISHMTCEIEEVDITSVEVDNTSSRESSNSYVESSIIVEDASSDLHMEDTQVSRQHIGEAEQEGEQVERNIDKNEDIRFHLNKILNSEGNMQPSRVVVKLDETPIIISEKGIVTVIYKPEKVKLRRNIEDLEPELDRRYICTEEPLKRPTEKGTFKRKGNGSFNQNEIIKSRRIQGNQEINRIRDSFSQNKEVVRCGDVKRKKNLLLGWPKKKYPPIRKVKYRGQMVYKCKDCDFAHPHKVTALRRHMVIHQPADSVDWFYCHMCNYRAKRKSNLKVHMVLHRHPNDIVWYKCSTCSKKFKHKNSLYSHEKRHVNRDDLELYVCNKCPYKTPFKYTLLQHTFNHEPADKKKLLSCSICSYSTYNKYYLSRHVNQTHSDPIYKCLLCDYESKFKANLESHTKRHFPQEEKLHCDFCDYSTNRRYTLALHNRNVHNIYGQEDQLYFCYHCAFQTRFKRCLVMHMSMHPVVQDESAMVTRIKTEITTE